MQRGPEPEVQCAQTTLDDFRLADGEVVRLQLAYTLCGPRHAPTYLLLHGYTGSHYAVAEDARAADSGWAGAWVGPGQALDTDRCQVLTVNLPGSSYGSQWQGAQDAHASVRGMAGAVDALLEQLGIDALEGVIGYSFGGYVALQLKADYPQRVRRVLGLCTAPKGRGSADELPKLRGLAEPAQRAGFRLDVLQRSGLPEWVEDQGPEAQRREHERVDRWAREFTADSLWRLRAAAADFDVGTLPADTTLVHASSDRLFPPPPSSTTGTHVVHTPYGHQALLYDPQAWTEPIRTWLAGAPLKPAYRSGDR